LAAKLAQPSLVIFASRLVHRPRKMQGVVVIVS
jgi:hypothetical protein